MKLIFLMTVTFVAHVHGSPILCKGKFMYRREDTPECSLCGICPPDIDEDSSSPGIHPECKRKSPSPLPVSQRGKYAWCRMTDNFFPACDPWTDPNGKVECVKGDHQMFVVYRPCRLACNPGYKLSESKAVECTDDLQWNDTLPHCVPNGNSVSELELSTGESSSHMFIVHHPILMIVLGTVGLVMSACTIGICLRSGKKPICTSGARSKVSDLQEECKVDINIQPCISRKLNCFTVPEGSAITVEAGCSCQGRRHQVKHLMVVSLAKPPRLFGNFLSGDRSSPVVTLPMDLGELGEAHFAWIAQVVDRKTKRKEAQEGNFSIEVDGSRCDTVSETGTAGDTQHLLSASVASSACFGTPGNERIPSVNFECEDMEGQVAMQRLLEDKSMMEELCRHLDRDQSQGQLSWHQVARRLLEFQQQDLSFLEYHLKGRLYEGPTSHIMTLLHQNGVPVGTFLRCCKLYPDSKLLVSRISDFLARRPTSQKALSTSLAVFDLR